MTGHSAYTVCIVGLGLMGGSLALALSRPQAAPDGRPRQIAEPEPGEAAPGQAPGEALAGAGGQAAASPWRVVGVDRDAATLAAALAAGAVEVASADLATGLAQADAVVLAVPVRAILALLPLVAAQARPGTLVLDLGSSKAAICAALAGLPAGLQPVGGHPMCGSEQAGYGAARADLYRDRPFVLCPLPRTAAGALAQAERLARAAGARPVLAEPAAHDAAVAAISHLPYAAAAALVRTVDLAGDPLAWTLAASGFRDTTRVAAGSVEVMLDTLLTNRAAVLACLDAFAGQLATLRAALAAGDEAALRAEFEAARARRTGLAVSNCEQIL